MASRSQKETFDIGLSLSASFCAIPCTIFLRGELGAGKTTFVQGLGSGLGLRAIVSPTYAIENRYGDHGEKLLHLDLYRIDPREAEQIVRASEDFPGIRVVEWSERLEEERSKKRKRGEEPPLLLSALSSSSASIHVSLEETSETTRVITITFHDIALPERSEIEQWRKDVALPEHIVRHCDAVGGFAKALAEEFLRRGRVARPEALQTAGELHDLLRFVDFLTVEDRTKHAAWKALGEQYGSPHEEACARFLAEKGYPGLALIIRPHGLHALDSPGAIQTTEQKLLFYADKRVLGDRVVTLDERFDEFITRYGKGIESAWAKTTRERTKAMERELFGKDIPQGTGNQPTSGR